VNRLAYVIAYTRQFAAMRDFYHDGLGLEMRRAEGDEWIEFDTLGASFALHAMDHDERQGVMLRFETDNLVRDMSTLLSRGVRFDGDVIELGHGRLVNLMDPEDNLITLFQPSEEPAQGLGPALGRVILNAEDFRETVAFYRDRMGFEIARHDEHWVEFDTGLTRLAVHTRPADREHPRHAEQPLAYTFETDDLNAQVESVRLRGLHFACAPVTEEFGAYAELNDPDGRVVVLREPPAPVALEEELAAAFADEDAPQRAAFRKPVKKATQAVSRLVSRPGYRTKKKAAKRAAAASRNGQPPKRAKGAASTRGAGPGHSRLKPKTLHDSRRAKVKPATGRMKKAVRKIMA
jgi:extradiol dioxygenase family protein